MYKVLFLALVASVMFSGCADKALQPAAPEKMYVDENTMILFALDAQNHGNAARAVGYYDALYESSGDVVYRDKALESLFSGRYYNDYVKRMDVILQEDANVTQKQKRLMVFALIGQKDMVRAEAQANALLKQEQSVENYLTLSEVYSAQKDYLSALEVLDSAYSVDYSEKILDKIAITLYVNMKRPYEAIGRIEQHSKNFGYSLALTKRLAAFYSDQQDEEGMLESYLHLYDLEPKQEYANLIIQLYWGSKDTQKLQKFLEKSQSNDALLLKLYISDEKYEKAIPLAKALYEQSGDLDYLGQKAIFMYESAKDRSDKALLKEVVGDLKRVVVVKEEGYYLNYLGYCLIEHDIDVDAGIAYVERALVVEPESGYFIDSLAWGYYKKGDCQKADALMKDVVRLMGDKDEEVQAHLKAIKKCLNKKGKK